MSEDEFVRKQRWGKMTYVVREPTVGRLEGDIRVPFLGASIDATDPDHLTELDNSGEQVDADGRSDLLPAPHDSKPGVGEEIPDDPDHKDIDPEDINKNSVARSARWSILGLLGKQVSRILFSIVLARFLGPENFGIVGQATIYIAFATAFVDLGLGAAIIQGKEINRVIIGTVTTVNLIVTGALVALTLLGAGLWAEIFSSTELAPVLRVLSITLALSGLAVVPNALLIRKLDFKTLGIAEIVSSVVSGATATVGALMGMEYWALVLQTILRDGIYAAMLMRVAGLPKFGWSREVVHRIAKFSRNTFGSQLLSFAGSNSDNLLIAWRLGAVDLANYSLSYRLLLLPVQILAQSTNRLVFPVLARLNDEPRRQQRFFLMTTSSLATLVTVPMVTVALGAPLLVPVVFGDQWDGAIVPMQILAAAAVFRTLSSVNGGVLLAKGKAHWMFRLNLFSVPVHIAGFVVGLNWGIEGVAWSYLVVGVPFTIAWAALSVNTIALNILDYARAMLPAASAAAVIAVVWTLTQQLAEGRLGDLGVLLVAGSASVAAVSLLLLTVFGDLTREQIALARAVVSRSKAGPSI